MALEQKLLTLAQTIGTDIKTLFEALSATLVTETLSATRSNEDVNGVFTTVTYHRSDSTLYKQSVLSGGTSPEYTTRTTTFYETDGTTVKDVYVFTLSYSDGVLVSEILQS